MAAFLAFMDLAKQCGGKWARGQMHLQKTEPMTLFVAEAISR